MEMFVSIPRWEVEVFGISDVIQSATRAAYSEENPLEVFGWQVTGKTGIDETFVGQMRFANDILMQFDSSFAIPFHAFMEIVGNEGTLNVPKPFQPYENEKIYLTHGDKTETIKIKGQELYIGEVENMADAILLGHEPAFHLKIAVQMSA